jgi:microcystin-dependent protein
MTIFGSGHEVVTSLTRPATPLVGQMIFETDTGSYRFWTGAKWAGVIPVGTIQAFAGAANPPGWEFCDGAALNSVANIEYADLFTAIGVTYGGSGASSFNVPNLSGRVPVGAGTGAQQGASGSGVITGGTALTARSVGQFFGDERLQAHTHTGTTGPENASHYHTRIQNSLGETAGMYNRINNDTMASGDSTVPNGGGSNARSIASSTQSANHAHSFTTGPHNQGQGAQQNLVPSVVTNYIIKI